MFTRNSNFTRALEQYNNQVLDQSLERYIQATSSAVGGMVKKPVVKRK
jgi:hypothetical protein